VTASGESYWDSTEPMGAAGYGVILVPFLAILGWFAAMWLMSIAFRRYDKWKLRRQQWCDAIESQRTRNYWRARTPYCRIHGWNGCVVRTRHCPK
jgi:hypothetical protein